MKNLFKGKIATVGIIIATLVLAGVAVFTAVRLYQLRQEAVAPTAPTSKPKAAEEKESCKVLTFNLTTATATATGTSTATATPTGTPTTTPSGAPNSCNGTCGSNANCDSSLFCYQGYCRNSSCPNETDCSCPTTTTTTATATATGTSTTTSTAEPSLPDAGTSLPTIFGIGLGTLLLIGAILLAL